MVGALWVDMVGRSMGVELDGSCALYTLFVLPFSSRSTKKLTIYIGFAINRSSDAGQ